MDPAAPIVSPCVGICELDLSGLCTGCLRTSQEVSLWASFSPAQRQYVMDVLLPERERQRGAGLG